MKPLVSVIVPVYNVEKFIGECVRSLFAQTLEEVEFIFVNDCTPDGSMEVVRKIMKEFPERADAVKFVDKSQNQGLPAARKSGLELAQGVYIAHCDSDDWMEPDMLERMYREAAAYDSDGVVCGWFRDNEPAPTKYSHTGENCRDFILKDMIAVGEMESVWRFMIKREVYSKGIEFPRFNQGEDHALMVQLAYHCRSIYCVDKPLYHWRTNASSITNSPSASSVEGRFDGACANARQVEGFLAKHGELERYASQLVALKLYCMFYMRPLLRKGEGLDKWRKEFPEIKGKVLLNKNINFTTKMEYLVDKYCPVAVVKAIYKWRKRCQ